MVIASSWAPDRGEIVWLNFNPQAGSEQAGHRPALVISPKAYNSKVGLAIFCPITSEEKQYPFEVRLPDKLDTSGVILVDQVKCLDWRVRQAKYKEKVPDRVMDDVLAKLATLTA